MYNKWYARALINLACKHVPKKRILIKTNFFEFSWGSHLTTHHRQQTTDKTTRSLLHRDYFYSTIIIISGVDRCFSIVLFVEHFAFLLFHLSKHCVYVWFLFPFLPISSFNWLFSTKYSTTNDGVVWISIHFIEYILKGATHSKCWWTHRKLLTHAPKSNFVCYSVQESSNNGLLV